MNRSSSGRERAGRPPVGTWILFYGSVLLVAGGIAFFSVPLGMVAAGGMLWWDLHWTPRRTDT